MLTKNSIRNNTSEIPDALLLSYVKQKPNKKILGIFRFHLWIYNRVNQEKFYPRYAKRLEKRKALNERRLAAQKKAKSEYPLSFNRWLLQVGEGPVLLDTLLALRSTKQLELYLKNHGYFNASVKDTILKTGRNDRLAEVEYQLKVGNPYRFKSLSYEITDPTINDLVSSDIQNSLIKSGNLYNVDQLDAERTRIADFLKNKGYFGFQKTYINYYADSSAGGNSVDVTLELSNPTSLVEGYPDSTRERQHIRYKINDIYIDGDYRLKFDSTRVMDTLYFNNIHYLSEGQLDFKPGALKPAISIARGDLYSKKNTELTYRRISDYKTFKFVNIQFIPVNADSSDKLNCSIQVTPMPRHAITLQSQGTNTAGNLGVALDLIYQNRNLFRGLELFEIRLNGGLEVQRILSDVDKNVGGFLPFNTILFGPESSLQFPKIPKFMNFLGNQGQKTRVNTSYNFQQRPDYKRTIFNLAFGYTARSSQRVSYTLNPAEINYVTVLLDPDFKQSLNQSNNLFLKNSFTSQLISAGKFSRTFNSQQPGASKGFVFFQWNLESAGILLNLSRNLFKNPAYSDGQYIVLGVPYSQYVRFDYDFRYFKFLNRTSSVAFRHILGLGVPYGNSSYMPFVKSFFVGGANGMRAWTARSLGPGGYAYGSEKRLDQIGDIKIEWNLEYRLKLYRMFEGAAFVDAGNIWLRKVDPGRPNANFTFNRFMGEIAMDAGMGLRLNFDYFIIRLDAAIPIRDPGYNLSNRWRFNNLDLKYVVLNFGIGYPF
jgi:outer membrane protein assembly factor BamA